MHSNVMKIAGALAIACGLLELYLVASGHGRIQHAAGGLYYIVPLVMAGAGVAIMSGRLALGTYGTSLVLPRDRLGQKMVMGVDQVLCGTNKTRRTTNQKIRRLLGRGGRFVIGERVVALKNDKDRGLLNGSLWEVQEIELSDENETEMVVKPLDPGMSVNAASVKTHHAWLDGREKELPWTVQRDYQPFDHAYALSVHKAQGSQWDSVLVLDESRVFREDASKWLYTALTRASERVVVAV